MGEEESASIRQDRLLAVTKKRQSSVGGALGVVGVFSSYLLARIAPKTSVGRLISAVGSPDEETSVAACMALVKLGPRNSGLLLEAARRGRQTSSILHVLGGMGDSNVIPDLEEFARSDDPDVASAARESIAALRGEEFDQP